MMGRNHLVTGVCVLEHIWATGILFEKMDNRFLIRGMNIAAGWFGLEHNLGVMENIMNMGACTTAIFAAAYVVGLLIPDIDNPNSMIGRYIHIPVKHRTWTHAVYLYIFTAAAGFFIHPAFLWFTLGVFIHLFWDSFSRMGNCWFYKLLSDYKEYPGGARIKKGRHLTLYRAGEWTEYFVTFIVVILTVLSFIYIRKGF